MARLRSLAISVLLLITLSSFVSNSQARKFLVVNYSSNNNNKDTTTTTTTTTTITHVPSTPSDSEGSLFLSALPKGKVPSSAPSKKGHAEIVNEKLIARHLIAFDRSLRSVPSPGVGH